jgi:hypothetical protein
VSELVIPPPQIEQLVPPPVITETLVGMQGPAGPPGAVSAYRHDQAAPSATWTINHNLARDVTVALYTTGSVEFDAEVVLTSDNQAVALLAAPLAGFARVI